MKTVLKRMLLIVMCLAFALQAFACAGTDNTGSGTGNSSTTSDTGSTDNNNPGGNGGGGTEDPDPDPEPEPDGPLHYSEIIDFTVEVEEGRNPVVLQISDIQILDGEQQRYLARIGTAWRSGNYVNRYRNYVRQVIERVNPDLIIMAGDNVYGEFDDSGRSWLELVSFMESFQIPWAPIMGNHDVESNMGADWQCKQLEDAKYCLFKQRELTGNGNYTVGIVQGGELKRVFYMMDSNGCANASEATLSNGHTSVTAGFGSDQIDWYYESITSLKEGYPDVKISFCFHIPLAIFGTAFTEKYGFNASTIAKNPINLDKVGKDGDFGVIAGAIGCWDNSNNVWNTFKELGVDSVFVGHEHTISASVMYQGIRLQFGQKSSTYDTHNCYYKSKDMIAAVNHSPDGSVGTPIIGGTVLPLSEETGDIVAPYIQTYDASYTGGSTPEADPGYGNVPGVTLDSDTTGTYWEQHQFERFDIHDLIASEDIDLDKGFSFNPGVEKHSVKVRVKTSANMAGGYARFYMLTEDGTRGSNCILITQNTIEISGYSMGYTFAPNTEYELEFGALRLYNGNTAYMFLLINGKLDNRWAIVEIEEFKDTYVTVRMGGPSDLFTIL